MSKEIKVYTFQEVIDLGIPHKEQPDFKCEYCGKPLEQLGMCDPRGIVHWVIRKGCDCEGAAKQRQEEAKRAEEQERRQLAAKLRRAGIAKRYLGATVRRSESIGYIEAFRPGIGTGLYFVGGVGAGKIYEASAIARSFIWAGYSVVFTTSLELLDSVHKGYEGKEGSSVSRFSDVDLLVLDDLGKENANSWVLMTLFQILNCRYEGCLPTVFTSQYSLEALEKRMSRGGERESAQAIVSRISQVSRVVNLGNRDRRRRA